MVPMPDPSLEDRYCLGSAYVVAALLAESKKRGWPVEVHRRDDLDHAIHTPEQIAAEVLSHRPDVVGFGLYVWNQHVARRVAAILKREDPRILVVGGGPFVSAEVAEFAMASPQFDVIVSGDGEIPFTEVVDRARTGQGHARFAGIPGTVVRVADDLHATPRVKADPNLYPSPYQMGLLDVRYSMRMNVRRGCGMHCRYCNWGGGFSVPLARERLAGDIAWATRQGCDEVWIVDSALNRRPADLKRIADAFALGDPDARLRSCAFLDWRAVDPSRLSLLWECRLNTAEIGLQTANPKALALAGRRLDLARFERAVEALRERADVVVDIILGLPGDDPEGFRRTVDYLVGLGVRIQLFLLMALPGSEYSHDRERYGLEFNRDGVPYLLRSTTFSPDDLRGSAAWFVTRVARKSQGSDFATRNPRFPRYPFNYRVPEEAFLRAHESFGDPLPPPPCVPGQSEDPADRLRRTIEALLGVTVAGQSIELPGVRAILRRCGRDRAQLDVTDDAGGRAEVFLRPRTPNANAYRKAGPFDIWYSREATLAPERLTRCLDVLAAMIEAGSSAL